MRGESAIKPVLPKYKKDRDRLLAKKAKEAMAKLAVLTDSYAKKN
ncbi:MAG TPA: hypothetical protein VLD37_04015 [Candidatus Bilamarchaeum sp.]|nr:hypothetical protein [Candidatus Bilamarchaeum sp.]